MIDESAPARVVRTDAMPERDTYDSPWKAVLRRYFQPCIELFLPEVAEEVDWERDIFFLDKELESLAPEAELGPRVVDLLVKVCLRTGDEAWILVHVEVQASPEAGFAERMLVYHYRIFDRCRAPVLSLAILADDRPSWRPDHFETGAFGTSLRLDFRSLKLLDWEPRRSELARSRNPFAAVVLAHLDSLRTKGDPETRYNRKWSLTRRLFELGYTQEDVIALYRFLDEVLKLPEPLESLYRDRVDRYQEQKRMPYITSIERLAREEGLEEGRKAGLHAAVLGFLEARFDDVPSTLTAAIKAIDDPAVLDQLVRYAALADTLEAFEAGLPQD